MSHSYACHASFPGIEPSLQGSAWHEIDGVPVHARAGQEVVFFRFSNKMFSKKWTRGRFFQDKRSFLYIFKKMNRVSFFLKIFHEIHCVPAHVHAGQGGFYFWNKEIRTDFVFSNFLNQKHLPEFNLEYTREGDM